MQDLGSLGGGGSLATSINNLGHIVGQSDNNRAFLWINGAMQELDTLEGGGATANGINDAGQIAGWSTVESGLQHAALWKNGAVQDLGTLGGTLSWAEGINNSGVVAGSSRNVNERWRAFTWQNGTMQDLGTFNDGHSYANAINDKGQVVGQADGKAFLWANGVMYDLCALAECTTAGWEYFWDATAINEAGDIVGYGRINGESQGYLLTVVPPPPVDLSGTIKTTNGTDICAMVLASGQYTFSCNPPGVFSLTGLPRRSDGTVKRQIYAHGFFPKIDTLPDSTNEDVVMTRSGICPNYNLPYDPAFVPGSAGKEIYIAGEVLLQNTQTSICAMVLANGQYMFSCDGTGSYFLKIPLDNNGQFKLQVYADGFAPSIRTFDEFKTTNIVRMARAVECQ
jgi:probable HAF family extracellular repeat protein